MESVKLITYPKLFYTWPVIFVPILCYSLMGAGLGEEAVGWIYLATLLLVIITMGLDMDRTTMLFGVISAIAFILASKVISFEFEFSIFSYVIGFFDGLNVTYNHGLAIAISLILGFNYIGMLTWSRIHNRWIITAQEFKHISFGVADITLARGAKSIKTSYPDLLEFTLGLSGTLHVYSANGDQELLAIENVPMLPFVRRHINSVLEGSPVTRAALQEEENVANG